MGRYNPSFEILASWLWLFFGIFSLGLFVSDKPVFGLDFVFWGVAFILSLAVFLLDLQWFAVFNKAALFLLSALAVVAVIDGRCGIGFGFSKPSAHEWVYITPFVLFVGVSAFLKWFRDPAL